MEAHAGLPKPVDKDDKFIVSESTNEEESRSQLEVTTGKLNETLDQLCAVLVADNYVEKTADGVKWRFRANNDLYSYMCLIISEKLGYENIPWNSFLSLIEPKGKKSYLKKKATDIRKGQKPKTTIVLDEAIRGLKLR